MSLAPVEQAIWNATERDCRREGKAASPRSADSADNRKRRATHVSSASSAHLSNPWDMCLRTSVTTAAVTAAITRVVIPRNLKMLETLVGGGSHQSSVCGGAWFHNTARRTRPDAASRLDAVKAPVMMPHQVSADEASLNSAVLSGGAAEVSVIRPTPQTTAATTRPNAVRRRMWRRSSQLASAATIRPDQRHHTLEGTANGRSSLLARPSIHAALAKPRIDTPRTRLYGTKRLSLNTDFIQLAK